MTVTKESFSEAVTRSGNCTSTDLNEVIEADRSAVKTTTVTEQPRVGWAACGGEVAELPEDANTAPVTVVHQVVQSGQTTREVTVTRQPDVVHVPKSPAEGSRSPPQGVQQMTVTTTTETVYTSDVSGQNAFFCDLCCCGFSIGNPTSAYVLCFGFSIGQPCGVRCCIECFC